MSKQEEIIEVAGKKVEVKYTRDGQPCEKCVLDGTKGCNSIKCSLLDRVGMEIDERAYFVEAEQSQEEEPHSLREWAQILAKNPELRAEFNKLCSPQPIQGSIAPEPAVNKYAVTHAFLKCDKAGKIVSEMYGNKFNNPRNRDKYLAFLGQVNLDDRFGELAEILRRYGAMPAPKEQPKKELGKYSEEENLAYRLNWVMQDYIKKGKDEEQEHRFKCYKLFWDALEDTTFFEQKEKKLVEWTGYSGIVIDKTEYSELTDAEWAILRGFTRITGLSHFPITIIKETAQDFLAHLPVEWSDDKNKPD